MNEKPILFSTPMVRVLLNTKPGVWPAEPIDDSKPYKSQTRRIPRGYDKAVTWCEDMSNICPPEIGVIQSLKDIFIENCLYNPGDVLWVRETWTKKVTQGFTYRADLDDPDYPTMWWKPSIHMPREAARIFLEVKSVRVERLQGLTESDSKQEGFVPNSDGLCGRAAFCKLWESLNAKRGYPWEDNPYVWVIEFMRKK